MNYKFIIHSTEKLKKNTKFRFLTRPDKRHAKTALAVAKPDILSFESETQKPIYDPVKASQSEPPTSQTQLLRILPSSAIYRHRNATLQP